jgi:hypothetical protein
LNEPKYAAPGTGHPKPDVLGYVDLTGFFVFTNHSNRIRNRFMV